MESKPILIIRVPNDIIDIIDEIKSSIGISLEEYYIIFCSTLIHKEINFEVLNCKDADEINIEELKEMINKELKQNNHGSNI